MPALRRRWNALEPILRLAGFSLVGLACLGPLLVLGIVYVITRYALIALTAWALRWTFAQLGDVAQLVTRVLPLMLLVVTFLYLSPGVWQAMSIAVPEAVMVFTWVVAVEAPLPPPR